VVCLISREHGLGIAFLAAAVECLLSGGIWRGCATNAAPRTLRTHLTWRVRPRHMSITACAIASCPSIRGRCSVCSVTDVRYVVALLRRCSTNCTLARRAGPVARRCYLPRRVWRPAKYLNGAAWCASARHYLMRHLCVRCGRFACGASGENLCTQVIKPFIRRPLSRRRLNVYVVPPFGKRRITCRFAWLGLVLPARPSHLRRRGTAFTSVAPRASFERLLSRHARHRALRLRRLFFDERSRCLSAGRHGGLFALPPCLHFCFTCAAALRLPFPLPFPCLATPSAP